LEKLGGLGTRQADADAAGWYFVRWVTAYEYADWYLYCVNIGGLPYHSYFAECFL
jgi:hypothetical protein